EKPRISAFTSANIEKILALQPDLVLTFSDLQAEIVADLVRRGLAVHAFNQRCIAGILDMIRTLGALVEAADRAKELVARVAARPGFAELPAVQNGDLYEIKSSLILQPGPAALTDGLTMLQNIIQGWASRR